MPLPKLPNQPATFLPASAYKARSTGDDSTAPIAASLTREPRRSVSAAPAASSAATDGLAVVERPAQPAAGRSAQPSARARTPAPSAPPGQAAAPASPAPVPTAAQPKPARKPKRTGPAKLFVLDTNVLMHDPMSLFRFEEHDVYLPMITLEELDGHKKGMSEVARNARQVSRDLDALAAPTSSDGRALDMAAGLALAGTGHREATGRLYFQTTVLDIVLPAGLPQGKADNQILGVVQALRREPPGPRSGAGVQRHQHAHQGAGARFGGRGLLQRQDAGRRRPALHRRDGAAGRLLGPPWQDDGELEPGGSHVLPGERPLGSCLADQSVRLP
jgi:PhoH-like ATPase